MVQLKFAIPLLVLLLGIICALIQSQMKYSFLFYVPGLLGRLAERTAPYEEIKWEVSPKKRSSKPNIILIIVDDLGVNDLKGGSGVSTPNIERLQKNGVTFTTAYAAHATCSPSRASILTGRLGARFGFEFTAIPTVMARFIGSMQAENATHPAIFNSDLVPKLPSYQDMVMPLDERTIAQIVRADGDYSTAYVGKWHLGESVGAKPHERGFQESLAFLKGASLYSPISDPNIVTYPIGDAYDDFQLYNLGYYLRFNNRSRFQPPEYLTDYLAREAVKVIRAKAAAPYFLTVAFNAPHTPLQAKLSDYTALSHIGDKKQRVYAAMIKALDEGVGAILDAVAAQEPETADNTLVIFTSDNGSPYYIGMGNNHPYRGGKYNFFEGGVRVPLLMQWPRVLPGSLAVGQAVSHVDIFMTIAAAAGADTEGLRRDRVYDGKDLRPLVEAAVAEPARDQTDYHGLHEVLYWRAGHYICVRYLNHKLSVSERPDRVWLYDLISDPLEHRPLVPRALEWTGLRSVLLNDTVTNGGCEAYVSGRLSVLCAGEREREREQGSRACAASPGAVAATVCVLSRKLVEVNSEQRPALWPALIEFPMGIDDAGLGYRKEDDYVYWSN